MSWKIYLIKHLDTDMKYVGITGGDLVARWEQHRADTNSAVYKALRTEGYRMTMELLEEVATKPEALRKEQEYIQSLGTATPDGWNRKVYTPSSPKPKKWKAIYDRSDPWKESTLQCQICSYEYTHIISVDLRSNDVSMTFYCEQCHVYPLPHGGDDRPHSKLFIRQHKGQTMSDTVYYIEDNS